MLNVMRLHLLEKRQGKCVSSAVQRQRMCSLTTLTCGQMGGIETKNSRCWFCLALTFGYPVSKLVLCRLSNLQLGSQQNGNQLSLHFSSTKLSQQDRRYQALFPLAS